MHPVLNKYGASQKISTTLRKFRLPRVSMEATLSNLTKPMIRCKVFFEENGFQVPNRGFPSSGDYIGDLIYWLDVIVYKPRLM